MAFSGIVNFEFHAKPSVAFSKEGRLRLVIVVVDYATIIVAAMACVASGLVAVLVQIIGIIMEQDSATVFTGSVIAIIATLAKGCCIVAGIII
jgi:hypothetical protein